MDLSKRIVISELFSLFLNFKTLVALKSSYVLPVYCLILVRNSNYTIGLGSHLLNIFMIITPEEIVTWMIPAEEREAHTLSRYLSTSHAASSTVIIFAVVGQCARVSPPPSFPTICFKRINFYSITRANK